MDTWLGRIPPYAISFVSSLVPLVFTIVAKIQLEKAKHKFEIQSQFHLEAHKRIWELWETYYHLTYTLEQMLSGNCKDKLYEEYASFYEKIVQQKRLLAPIIPLQLDRTLEQFLEVYHPLNTCNVKTDMNYQKLHNKIVNQFREALR